VILVSIMTSRALLHVKSVLVVATMVTKGKPLVLIAGQVLIRMKRASRNVYNAMLGTTRTQLDRLLVPCVLLVNILMSRVLQNARPAKLDLTVSMVVVLKQNVSQERTLEQVLLRAQTALLEPTRRILALLNAVHVLQAVLVPKERLNASPATLVSTW
jgi:hypothetical protein